MDLKPILYEIKPTANANVTLYTVSSNEYVTGTIFCLNQDEYDDRVSVALVSNGNVLTANSYICFETTAYRGQSIYLQQIYLGSEDSINVWSARGTSNFIFTGYKM